MTVTDNKSNDDDNSTTNNSNSSCLSSHWEAGIISTAAY